MAECRSSIKLGYNRISKVLSGGSRDSGDGNLRFFFLYLARFLPVLSLTPVLSKDAQHPLGCSAFSSGLEPPSFGHAMDALAGISPGCKLQKFGRRSGYRIGPETNRCFLFFQIPRRLCGSGRVHSRGKFSFNNRAPLSAITRDLTNSLRASRREERNTISPAKLGQDFRLRRTFSRRFFLHRGLVFCTRYVAVRLYFPPFRATETKKGYSWKLNKDTGRTAA